MLRQTNQQPITALYPRLSHEDELQGGRNSISNQKLILQKYADENGFQNTRFYVGDGYSGVNFNRPAFEQMMDDMSKGSLPPWQKPAPHRSLHRGDLDVRYIAINDNVDTLYETSNELMPFKNLFNEWYVWDCSRKVRNVLNAKA